MANEVYGTFAHVKPLPHIKLILGIICLFFDSIMANTYSMFYPTHENGPASYIRRNNAFCFSMTVSLSLLDRQENGFIPGPDKNPTCPESPACTAKDALSRHRGIHRHSSNASRILTNLRITIPTKSIHSWNVVREHSTGISINDLFH